MHSASTEDREGEGMRKKEGGMGVEGGVHKGRGRKRPRKNAIDRDGE